LGLWGDHDPYIDRGFAERFGEGAGAKAVQHLGVGHWFQAEAPDEVAAHIRAHLAR
jgi:pimeloyl-ACP methyl ester carboxylesterase